MDLLDRYLRAVEFWLPNEQRGDVIDELSDDLRSEIDDKRAATGRTPSEDEVAAILKERGHPMLVAGRYLPQQYLIGPTLLPLYRFVLRMLLLWILVPAFVLVIAPIAVIGGEGPLGALIATVLGLAQAALFTFGIVTLAFGAIERYGLARGLYARWDPRRLPALPVGRAPRTQPIGATIFALACRVVFYGLVAHARVDREHLFRLGAHRHARADLARAVLAYPAPFARQPLPRTLPRCTRRRRRAPARSSASRPTARASPSSYSCSVRAPGSTSAEATRSPRARTH